MRQRIVHQFRKHNKPGGAANRVHAGALGQAGAGETPALLSDGPATVDQLSDPAGARLDAIWDEEWEKHVLSTALAEVKRQVSDRQFQIFDLYALQNWPALDVARTLKVNAAQVYLAKHRVARMLTKELRNLKKEMQ